ncbi:hypothetical protein C0989_008642, partial [Termitomyces sp. Mn162]
FLCLPKFLSSPTTVQTPRMCYDPNIPTTTPDLTSAQPRNSSRLGDLLSNSGSAPINREASAYPAF